MIKELTVNQFTIFKKAKFQFGKSLNVLIGENGAGKTQVLKLLYAMTVLFPQYQKEGHSYFGHVLGAKELETFKAIFKVGMIAELVNMEHRNKKTKVLGMEKVRTEQGEDVDVMNVDVVDVASNNTVSFEKDGASYEYDVELKFRDVVATNMRNAKGLRSIPAGLIPESLFLPTREMLTIYPNYQSLSKKYHLPYDQTYDDTIVALGLPYQKEITAEYDGIVEELEKAIDGEIILRNEKFYFHPNSAPQDQDFDINMTAEGWRKLGMVLQLLKNGGLHTGMALFWDEPEANLNPQLIRLIAKVIVQLSRQGIQVFLTTHSLFLLREVDMLTKAGKSVFDKGDVRFFNFIGKGKVEQGNTPEELGDILLLDESMAQSDRFMKMEE